MSVQVFRKVKSCLLREYNSSKLNLKTVGTMRAEELPEASTLRCLLQPSSKNASIAAEQGPCYINSYTHMSPLKISPCPSGRVFTSHFSHNSDGRHSSLPPASLVDGGIIHMPPSSLQNEVWEKESKERLLACCQRQEVEGKCPDVGIMLVFGDSFQLQHVAVC